VTEAQKKLRDALLGVPGEVTRHGPGYAVAEYQSLARGLLYDVIDGDGDAVCQCKSSEVASAIADVCNEVT
jgi:hypothetical protein